ncbi:MAG TPA: hypothetical protein VF214_08705 [Edaphobacter sp.]
MMTPHRLKPVAAMALALSLFIGCQSKQDAALDEAKKKAIATGQPQQVITADKDGNVTTTTIQPPAPGQTGPTVTTTVTPATKSSAIPSNTPAVAPGAPATQPATASAQPEAAPAAVAPPEVHVPAGTTLAIRINQHISVKTSNTGDHFDGEIAEPVHVSDRVIIPRGTPVAGVVDASHKRGHFKGASVLELRLTSLTLNGTRYPISTGDLTRTKKGKGKRSAAMIGGGTGAGMLIGGLASGGTGLLIGGLAGAGAGTAAAGMTGNGDIDIPAESLVRFRLSQDLVLQPS